MKDFVNVMNKGENFGVLFIFMIILDVGIVIINGYEYEVCREIFY